MGGNIAMPGLEAHIQVIDVRDLASWLVAGFERDRCGIWNAVGTALTWADLAAAGTSIGPPGTRVH
ncbi:MAG: reductase, partial [Flavobacteriaceae bacterium]